MTTTIFRPTNVVNSGRSHLVVMPEGRVVMLKHESENGYASSEITTDCCVQLLDFDRHRAISYRWRLLPLAAHSIPHDQARELQQCHDEKKRS